MGLRLEEQGNTQKIFRENTLEGTIVKQAENKWEYTNCIGRKGVAATEREAFVNLGFFKGKRPPIQIGGYAPGTKPKGKK